jgi:hypothetical protein
VNAIAKKAQVLEFKRGDTVMLGCAAKDSAGAAVNLTGVEVEAELRTSTGELICAMEFEPANLTLGTYELWVPADIEPTPGDHKIDIQYTDTSGARPLVRSSETFYIRIIGDVTA